jgi:hypothetical protein
MNVYFQLITLTAVQNDFQQFCMHNSARLQILSNEGMIFARGGSRCQGCS